MNKNFIRIFIVSVVVLLLNYGLSLVDVGDSLGPYFDDFLFNTVRLFVYIYVGVSAVLSMQISRKMTLLFGLALFFVDSVILRFVYFYIVFFGEDVSAWEKYWSSLDVILLSFLVFLPIIAAILIAGYAVGMKVQKKESKMHT